MFDSLNLGVFYALTTAFSWASAGYVHTAIARRIGVRGVLLLRQIIAVLALALACLLVGIPLLVPSSQFWPAALSGLSGILIGDAAFYSGVLRIGLRPGEVCLSLSAAFTAIIGILFLGENLGLQGMAGIAIATTGVIMVITTEHGDTQSTPTRGKAYRLGLLLCLSGALCQAIGMIFSKVALNDGMSTLSLALYRNAVSAIGIMLITLKSRNFLSTLASVRPYPVLYLLIPLGCLLGPAGGIWLSCLAIEALPASVAATIIGLQPIALLIIMAIMERRMPHPGSMIGAVVACSGTAILLLR